MKYRVRVLPLLIIAIAIVRPCAAQKDSTVHGLKVNRGRIVGVFDAMTGLPVEGAEVKDMASGMSSHTTETGTLSLFFVEAEASVITVRKVGYHPTSLLVQNSPLDTSGVTVLLMPVGHVLEGITVVSRMRRGAADTVLTLMQAGFYERRNSGLAPGSAFLTADRVHGLSLISDVHVAMGRAVCTTNLYINGAKGDNLEGCVTLVWLK